MSNDMLMLYLLPNIFGLQVFCLNISLLCLVEDTAMLL